MSTIKETGHAKNVANFDKLIAYLEGYGSNYNPTKNALKISELKDLEADAKKVLEDVLLKVALYNDAVNQRAKAFEGIRKLSTRVINALEATDTTEEKIEDAKSYNRKIQGKRSSKAKISTDPSATPPETISVSHQSYDLLIQHLKGMVEVLKSEPNYAPNENELKIASLQDVIKDLDAKNHKLAIEVANIANARIARNELLYKAHTGLVDIALEVKKYVKSVFGATSSQFAQVNGINFSYKR